MNAFLAAYLRLAGHICIKMRESALLFHCFFGFLQRTTLVARFFDCAEDGSFWLIVG
jgi:hypothetical protein